MPCTEVVKQPDLRLRGRGLRGFDTAIPMESRATSYWREAAECLLSVP